jgi:hypothetical protein
VSAREDQGETKSSRGAQKAEREKDAKAGIQRAFSASEIPDGPGSIPGEEITGGKTPLGEPYSDNAPPLGESLPEDPVPSRCDRAMVRKLNTWLAHGPFTNCHGTMVP